jgi:hypothetical protein
MYSVSAEYLAAIASGSTTTRITGVITKADLSTINITSESPSNIKMGTLFFSERAVDGDDIDIGATYATEFGAGLILADDLAGATIEPVFGLQTAAAVYVDGELVTPAVWEDIPLGKYYVADPGRISDGVLNVLCGDGMFLLDIPVGTPPATGTAWDYLDYIATTCSITLAQNEAAINALPNGTYTITYPAQSEIDTCRQLLKWIAQLLGGFAVFNRDGKLEIRDFTSASVRNLPASVRAQNGITVSDEQKTVSAVSITLNGTRYTEANTPDNGYTILLKDNPLIRGESSANIGTLLTAILGEVDGIAYYPSSFELLRNDPALEVGDYVTLTGGVAGAGVLTLITNNRWQYRRNQSIAGVGRGIVAKAMQTLIEKQLQLKVDIAWITEIIAEVIRAGKKIIIGDAAAAHAEIYVDSGVPKIDMYDASNVRKSSWHFDGLDFYDSLGTLSTRIATTTENRTITVGPGKDYPGPGEALATLPKILNHDITIYLYTDTYSDLTIQGFIGIGTLAIGIPDGEIATITGRISLNRCSCPIVISRSGTGHIVASGTSGNIVTIQQCNDFDVQYVQATGVGGTSGFTVISSRGRLLGCEASNKDSYGFLFTRSDVTLSNISGSGNGRGIYATDSTIHGISSSTVSGTLDNEYPGSFVARGVGAIASGQDGMFITGTPGAAGIPAAFNGSGDLIEAAQDGWTPSNEAWIYASASSFTVSGDKTRKYQIGDKIKLTQTTAKYFNIIGISYSSPNTTVTVTGGSAHTLANAAITSPYYSKIENPQGWPDWFACAAPTFAGIDNGSGGAPSVTECRFKIDKTTATYYMRMSGTKAGTDQYISFASSGIAPAIDTSKYTGRCSIGSAMSNANSTEYICTFIYYVPTGTFYLVYPSNITDNWTIADASFRFSYEF